MSLLVCTDLLKRFGGLAAISHVSLEIQSGELVGLIGPNGAGKTTLFNLITGFLRPTSGRVRYAGQEITGRPPHAIGSLGLVRTFQKINVFAELTVLDNVLIGRHLHLSAGFSRALVQSRRYREEEQSSRAAALRTLAFVGLAGWEHRQAKHLPFGLQRALGIATALAAEPKLLLLDEPASGMNTEEKKKISEIIRRIHAGGITVLLVEHDMNVVMSLCERIVVLDAGSVLMEGAPERVQHDPRVIEVYLGKSYRRTA
jgi:ABC-type branched-subunit amino acid transport system ATPase component